MLSNSEITNTTKADIISFFLIQPYIKGQIENASHYFNKIDRLKKRDLDLVLLTQGWSKYEWSIIKKGGIPVTYDFEVGLKIEGTFNRDAKKNKVNKTHMFSMTNGVNEYAIIDKINNRFTFDNYFSKDEAIINFSLYEDEKVVAKVNPVITSKYVKKLSTLVSNSKNFNKKGISKASILRTAFKALRYRKIRY